jgi:cell division protein FtsW (lipid II flippase)
VSIPAPPRPAAPPAEPEPSVPKRRNVELALSMFAVAIAMFAYANVGLADNGKLPAGMWGYGAGLLGVVVAANLLIRYAAPYADPLFLPLAVFLNGIGLVLIHRIDLHRQALARISHKSVPTGSAPNQLMFTGLGIIAFAGILLLIKDHKILQRYAYISMVAGLFLVAIPAALPNSVSGANGAKSWVRFPGGISIQPAEFGKLLLVSFFAAFLVSKRDALRVASRKFMGMHVPRGRDLGPIAVCWLFAMGVLFVETDLGVSLMFFGAFVVLLYIATERTSWLLIGVVAFLGGATFIAMTSAHVKVRITAWLHPFDVETTRKGSEQIAQSIYGFATGGIFGKGLNQGRPWLVGFASDADFILVSVGEELGMIGLFALMLVYMLIVMRGFKTAILIRDNYGKLLASGLAVTFALQVFITAGGVMRVIPLTGLPMPFLAAGGSALVANWVVIAAFIRLSDAARRPPPPAIPLTDEDLRAMRLAAAARIPSNAPPQYSAATQAIPPRPGVAGAPGVPAQGVNVAPSHQPRPGYGERPPASAADPTQVVRPASHRAQDPDAPSPDSELTEAYAMPYADGDDEAGGSDEAAVTEAIPQRRAARAYGGPAGAPGGVPPEQAEVPEPEPADWVEADEPAYADETHVQRELSEHPEVPERPGQPERRYGP